MNATRQPLGVLAFCAILASPQALSEETVTAKTATTSVALEQPAQLGFKRESSSQDRSALIVFGFLAIVAAVGASLIYKRGRSNPSAILNKRIRVLERSVLSHGLLAVMIEVENESFLVIQDKNKHSVTRLKVNHDEQE